MEMLCDWTSSITFYAGEVQATCTISSVVDLQNLLVTMLVLGVVFNLKTKQTPSSSLHSRQPKSKTRTLTLSLHHRLPHSQMCLTLLATTLPKDKIVYVWDVQRRWRQSNHCIFFCPILEHFCPLSSFVQIAQMGLILPRWGPIMGSHFTQTTTTTPCCLFSSHKPVLGRCTALYALEIPQNPPQNTQFLGLNLKVGKMNCRLGKMDPTWGKCLKSGQNFSRSGQKNYSWQSKLRKIGRNCQR